MRALTLRRAGFAATLVSGLVLTGSAVHGLSGMDTTLELAAATSDRPVLAVDRERPAWGGCDPPRTPDWRLT